MGWQQHKEWCSLMIVRALRWAPRTRVASLSLLALISLGTYTTGHALVALRASVTIHAVLTTETSLADGSFQSLDTLGTIFGVVS